MKQRENNRFIKERKDAKGRLICLVPTCKNLREKYKKGKRFRNYCKNHTFWDMREFTNWASLRKKVLKRDKYTCVKCGDNRKEAEVKIIRKRAINIKELIDGKCKKLKYEESEYEEVRGNLIADHIKPIALGGDEWDLKNIQTLCQKCNKIKTKKDMKKIAEARRKEKLASLGQKNLPTR